MTGQVSEAAVVFNPVSTTLDTLAKWTGAWTGAYGSALATLLVILSALCAFAFPLVLRRYLGILGASEKKKGTLERQYYDGLRDSLMHGNIAARLYASRLTAFLDWIDRFFGDAGMADRTLFPRAFGLKTPAPLWTAPAFDRCLLLALIYPFMTILCIWAMSGNIGPAEAALGLNPNVSFWRRGMAALLFGLSVLALWRSARTPSLMGMIWYFVGCALGAAFIFTGIGANTASVASGLAIAFSALFLFAGAIPGIVVVTFAAMSMFGLAGADFITGALPGFLVGVGCAVVAIAAAYGIFLMNNKAIRIGSQGVVLSVFSLVMILACLGAPRLLSSANSWGTGGPLLLFLGLLTLINAPFDWASLGLTRALLRRGLELGGWWPYFLALADAILAAIIIALLALAMVVAVQAFDALAVRGGGKPVLPLQPFFDGIAANPTSPEYWWVYALLLSTMIPSLVNLVIAGTSLLRGIPGLPSLLLHFMPAGKAVPTFDRAWIALVLTLQVFVGALLGILAQALLAIVVIVYIMPPFGLGLLDMAREVAAFDLPARIGRLFAGG